MDWFVHVLVVVLAGYGMAVALVEKKKQWPIRYYHLLLKLIILPNIHRKLPKMLDCTVCTSFWTTLVIEILMATASCLYNWSFAGLAYWGWPLTGFIAVGFTWTVMDVLISFAATGDSLTRISKRE